MTQRRLGITPDALAKRGFLRRALGGASALLLGGCDRIGQTDSFASLLSAGEALNRCVRSAIGGASTTMAQEFTPADLSPTYRGNGNTDPGSPAYKAMAANGFADWKLAVDGLVEAPGAYTLAELRAMPARTQITRHDCVEGWSAIGQRTGVPLGRVLALVKPKPAARCVVLHCADTFGEGADETPYSCNAARMLAISGLSRFALPCSGVLTFAHAGRRCSPAFPRRAYLPSGAKQRGRHGFALDFTRAVYPATPAQGLHKGHWPIANPWSGHPGTAGRATAFRCRVRHRTCAP